MADSILVDARLAATLRPELPRLAGETVAALAEELSDYAGHTDSAAGRGLRWGVENALGRFVDLIGGETSDLRNLDVYRRLGEGEWREGRTLDVLQSAYRLGARVAWRRFGEIGTGAGFSTETMNLLAEAVFAYIEEIAAQSVAGYLAARSASAGEQRSRRQRLVRLLLNDPPVERTVLEDAATLAGWRVPAVLMPIALDSSVDAAAAAAQIGPDALHSDERHCILVPDPEGPGRKVLLDRACANLRAAAGPVVHVNEITRAVQWARELLTLVELGRIAASPLPRADDNLLELLEHRGEDLISAMWHRHAGPFDDLDPVARERTIETVLVWLQLERSATATAKVLHVHPQTVRYRLGRARELLEGQPDDRDSALELQLALRASSRARFDHGESGMTALIPGPTPRPGSESNEL